MESAEAMRFVIVEVLINGELLDHAGVNASVKGTNLISGKAKSIALAGDIVCLFVRNVEIGDHGLQCVPVLSNGATLGRERRRRGMDCRDVSGTRRRTTSPIVQNPSGSFVKAAA